METLAPTRPSVTEAALRSTPAEAPPATMTASADTATSAVPETSALPTPTSAPPAGPRDPCILPTVVAPTPPAKIPRYAELDPDTGLHVTGTYQEIDLATYRLRVTGLVDRPLALTYDEIRCLPRIEAAPLLVCPGFFEDRATWAGAPVRDVLALAGVQAGAAWVEFVSADGYSSRLPLWEVEKETNFLAYEWQGQPLPRLHGFPLRAVIPDRDGNSWTKWLVEIRLVS
jgi:DMSO/TMAO reductase YedYZ molybdopterin-dependent catalytic subunit